MSEKHISVFSVFGVSVFKIVKKDKYICFFYSVLFQ